MTTPTDRERGSAATQLPSIEIAGLEVQDLDESQCVAFLETELRCGRGGWIVTANADIARLCNQRAEIKALVDDADLLVADGMPLIWASWILGQPLRERVCGSELVWSIAASAASEGRSLFLLGGGQPDTAPNAGRILRQRFPTLRIAGTHFPPFGFEQDPAQIEVIRTRIGKASPDIVYVAMGFPKSETLIHMLREAYPATWWIGVGISLSFIAGEIPRAPRWMQKTGLEWLHRLFQEPGRLTKRYLLHDIPFVINLLFSSLLQRVRPASLKRS